MHYTSSQLKVINNVNKYGILFMSNGIILMRIGIYDFNIYKKNES
jgi:hypothetical protein